MHRRLKLIDAIKQETNRRKLLGHACVNEGNMKCGIITPEYYAECCVLLAEKLGFAITPDNLDKAYKEYTNGT